MQNTGPPLLDQIHARDGGRLHRGLTLEKVKLPGPACWFGAIFEKVAAALEKVAAALEKVAAALEKDAAALEKVAAALEKVAAALQKVAAALEKVAAALEKVAWVTSSKMQFWKRLQ